MRHFFISLFFLTTIAAYGQAQTQTLYTREQLEQKRKEILGQIKETEEQLDAIKQDKNASLAQLKVLQNKLYQRQSLINNINEEMSNIDVTIKSSSREVGELKLTLEQLKVRYAQSIRYSYETRSSYDMLAFLFSSADFNDAVRRMKYLHRFRDYRKEQVEQIRVTQAQLSHKIGVLNTEKAQKEELVTAQVQQKQALEKETNITNTVIQDLKGKEGKLMKDIQHNREVNARISKAINLYIEREMAAAAKRAEKEAATHPGNAGTAKTGNNGGEEADITLPKARNRPRTVPEGASTLFLTPTEVALANNFEGNRGKLPWPVDKGYIISHFGRHPHPVEGKVEVDEHGVEIQTTDNAAVKAVFDGTVTSIFSADGTHQIVLVQHGNFFTVYSNLASASVSKGQQVTTHQVIGVAGINDYNIPAVEFQIWKSLGRKGGTTNLNPEIWLGRAH